MSPMQTPAPATLSGHGLSLRPLSVDDAPALFTALAGDQDVWRWLWTPMPQTEAEMRGMVQTVLDANTSGAWVSFAVVPDGSDGAVGMTSYLDISLHDRRLEIGGTWYGKSVWAGRVNPAAKFLLLQHAFEVLGAERVSLKTDHLNTRSQAAIARLGAVCEGVWRHHIRRLDGTWRDTVYFSILREEWPDVKAGLETRLA